MFCESHVGICRHRPQHPSNCKKGEGSKPFPFFGYQNRGKVYWPLLGFTSLVFLLHWRSARRLIARLHITTRCRRLICRRWRCWSRRWRWRRRRWFLLLAAPCKGQGKSEEGYSRQQHNFLSHPEFTSFPVTLLWKSLWLGFLYRISLPRLQGDFLPGKPRCESTKLLFGSISSQ